MAPPRSEFDFIAWLRAQPALPTQHAGLTTIPLGDDCAGLNLAGRGDLLVTTDIRLDGRHFRLAEHTPAQVGHKALACSLSDLAAMAAVPVGAVVAVALPVAAPTPPFDLAPALYAGMAALCRDFACPIVGGDTTTWPGPLALCVTCLGTADGLPPLRRSTARAGDLLCVTGQLGGSILGRHLTFTPRLPEARRLAQAGASSMIDLSDGLAGDLRHICALSGVRAELDDAALLTVAHADAHTLAARDGRPLLEHVLCDGEDFELLFTVPPDRLGAVQAAHLACGMTVVGRILPADAERPLIEQVSSAGERRPLTARGFEHGA